MNEINISNEALLMELGKRIKVGKIKIEGDNLLGQSEKNENCYYSLPLNINVGNLVNQVIWKLRDEVRFLNEKSKILEKRLETD